ncbi:MAG: hypothetical protein K2X38_18325 [Gemmataceae bacterium]|nr:hypothetical protein [Gemmataceae bacterium]
MATFYVMPPRPLLGQRFGDFLSGMFPDQSWRSGDWADLAESLANAAEGHAGVYVVFAEDLAEDVAAQEALQRDFGAEPGDDVIEVRATRTLGDWNIRRWQIERPARRAA